MIPSRNCLAANSIVLAVVAAFVLGRPAESAKITVDPNSSPRPSQVTSEVSTSPLDADKRLDQRVTYVAKHVPLKTVLSDLSNVTGVVLRSGVNTQDWQARDRRICVFVKDVQLRSLMRSIARVMHFKWSVTEVKGRPTYRIVIDRAALRDLNRKLSDEEQRFEEAVKENRRKLIDSLLDMANISTSDLEKLKGTNPYLYSLEAGGAGNLIRTLSKDCPEATDALLNGTNYYATADQLDAPVLQAITKAARGYRGIYEGRGLGKQEYLDAMESNISKAWLRVYGQGNGRQRSPERLRDLGSLLIKLGPHYETFTYFLLAKLMPPDSAYANQVASLYLEHPGDQLYAEQSMEEHKDELGLAYDKFAAQTRELYPGEPMIEHPDEEWMHTKVDMGKSTSGRLRDVLERLAGASGRSVVSDSFVISKECAGCSANEPTGDVLRKIAEKCEYNWEKHDDILEFTDRQWLYKRSIQIPSEWVEQWAGNTKRNRSLQFDDFVQIAHLTDEQLQENFTEDEVMGSQSIYKGLRGLLWRGARSAICLYGVLNGEQLKLLWSESGLPKAILTPEQLYYAQQIVEGTKDWDPRSAWCQRSDICFRGTLTTDPQKGDTYTISMVWEDKKANLYASYTMPRYEPPQQSTGNGVKGK